MPKTVNLREARQRWAREDAAKAIAATRAGTQTIAPASTIGVTTPIATTTAASGVPDATGTATPTTEPAHPFTIPPSVAQAPGVRAGRRSATVSGESARSPIAAMSGGSAARRQITTAHGLATARDVIASAQRQAEAAQHESQASRSNRFHQPSVSGNASGAASQQAREAAEVARIRETQIRHYGR